MYQHSEWKSGLLQQLVRLRNLGQRAPENVWIAVDRLLERVVQVDDRRPHLVRRQNVPILEQIYRVVSPEPVEATLDHVVLRILVLLMLLLLLVLVLVLVLVLLVVMMDRLLLMHLLLLLWDLRLLILVEVVCLSGCHGSRGL